MGRYCLNCGFDLRATPIGEYDLGECPECGRCFEEGNWYSYAAAPPRSAGPVLLWLGLVMLALIVLVVISGEG